MQVRHQRTNQPAAGHRRPLRSWPIWLVGAAGLLAACAQPAVVLRNTEPARQLAEQQNKAAAAPGALYAGWRVYQQRCAVCHGAAADGQDAAPSLLFRLRDVEPQRFVDLVLRRYERDALPVGAGSPRETLLDEIVERKRGELSMPAWQNEPTVVAHVMDLYAYLSARADGRLAAGRPAR